MSQIDQKRRALSAGTALALLGFPLISIGGCGGGGTPAGPSTPTPTPPPPPPTTTAPACPTDAVCGQASGDPDHIAVITGAQLAAGGALLVNIMGMASHNHTVSLSASEVVAIRGRTRVTKGSSRTLNHNHEVTFN